MLLRPLPLTRALADVPKCPLAVPSLRRCHRPVSPHPRDLAVPNAAWSDVMRRHYCHLLASGWTRLPSFRRAAEHCPGAFGDTAGDTRLFPRAIEGDGNGFEFAMFLSVPKGHLRCLCQLGPCLEGHPGLTHGGAIATLVDTSLGALALALAGRVVTANLSIDYVAPVPLGSVVLLDSVLQRRQGRKVWVSCELREAERGTLLVTASGLFIQQGAPKEPARGGDSDR